MKSTPFPAQPILIADDDEDLQRSYGSTLRHSGMDHVVHCTDSRTVESRLKETEFSVILLDLNMPYVSGRDLLSRIAQSHPDIPIIVATGMDEVKTAVACMKEGAFDYLVKPVDGSTLTAAIRRALDLHEVRHENRLLKKHLLSAELLRPEAFAEVITANKSMHALFQYVEAVAQTHQPILITGETGVGKELIARAVHRVSNRQGPFVAVNIAGLDDTMFSDTLFGHLKGAFTGATEARKGVLEQAMDGTLFLDEIGELNAASQIKLLRLLQEREYLPLGSDVSKHSNARIVVATNRGLDELRSGKSFREDLFFRLRSHHVDIPPLRNRQDDLPLLVDHFLSKAAREMNKKKPTPPRELYDLLRMYPFPGNIRELEGMVFNAVSTHKAGVLGLDAFQSVIVTPAGQAQKRSKHSDESAPSFLLPNQPLPTIAECERFLIAEALTRTAGNRTMAASLLGITRQTLNRHLKER